MCLSLSPLSLSFSLSISQYQLHFNLSKIIFLFNQLQSSLNNLSSLYQNILNFIFTQECNNFSKKRPQCNIQTRPFISLIYFPQCVSFTNSLATLFLPFLSRLSDQPADHSTQTHTKSTLNDSTTFLLSGCFFFFSFFSPLSRVDIQ